MRIFCLIPFLLLAACATGRDPNYSAYLEARQAAVQQESATLRALSDASASCGGDATCVVAVAGFAAMAARGQGGGPAIQPYVRQPSAAERIGLALVGQISPLASAAVSWRASDNSRAIALGQYDFLGGTMAALANSPALTGPSITVGGDYVSGRQHIGDSIGGDYIGGDQHIGDHIGRDAIGGDQRIGNEINIGRDDNSGNSGRINSPGPYDWDIDNGDRCSGTRCQGDGDDAPPNPDPAPDPEPDPAP